MSDPYTIRRLRAIEIFDSRGNPTIQVEVFTEGGHGCAAVPSGTSTGTSEAVELRDQDQSRYYGMGVLQAINNVQTVIAEAIIGMDCREQEQIDRTMIELDNTPNKSRLGANAILGVSLAVASAAADTAKQPLYRHLRQNTHYILPVPMMNIINGAKHAGNKLAFQEFHIMPIGFKQFLEALRAGVEIYHTLKQVLFNKYGTSATNVGDEGGFAPPMYQNRDALNALLAAVEETGYEPGKEIGLAIDAAATGFYKNGEYSVDRKQLKPNELIEYYRDLCRTYPLVSIEDPFEEDDFKNFATLTKELGKTVQIVGDDLFVTNPERLQEGFKQGAANALLLKVNQIGTLTEALFAADLATAHKYGVIVSHRSGETQDTFIADLSIALSRGQIKTGAPARSDRTAKYNRLIEIAHELGSKASYPGTAFRFP